MSLYTRARRHIDMDRVKELREEKIKREQIAKLVQEQERIRAELEYIEAEESKYINWRKELDEGMTTAGLGVIYLDGTPNVLSNEISAFDSESATVANVLSGGSVKLGVDEGQPFTDVLSGSNHTQLRRASFDFDSTRYDTFVVNITNPGGGQGSWCDPSCVYDNIVRYTVYDSDNLSNSISGTLSNGDNTIQVPSNLRVKNVEVYIRQYASDGVYSDGYNPPFTINSISTKRLSPMSLFVALDDPEANSFVRDGTADKMSPGEKRKKLEEQLRSSEEYLNKMFGEGMPKGATIADYEPQQSFSDIKVSLSPEDLKAISDRVGGSYSGSKGTEIAAAQQGPIRPGPRGYKKPGTYDPKKFFDLDNKTPMPSPNLPATGPGYSKGTGDTQVASARGPYGTPGADKPYTRRGYKDKDGKFVDYDDPSTWPKIPKASRKQRTMVAHHEPEGKVIKEKKSFKDITKKIPGYYDGKPSPLGFPVEEPPKMKNGFHPDLVDGKKVANRFNRLDPQSAKAMPKTGNPHIDKKVRAAAKKPK